MNTLTDGHNVVNQPPYTDRGVDSSHNSIARSVFSLDWSKFTIWCSKDALMPLLALLGVDVGLVELSHGGTGFRAIWQGLNGFQLYCDPINDAKVYCSVNMPAGCLQAVGLDKLNIAMAWLYESGFKWRSTRCDYAFDTQMFTVQQFVDGYEAGLVQTGARYTKEITERDGGDAAGHTFYIGSRQSLAMVRVYHKTDGCSFGDEPFTRVELELKGVRAEFSFLGMMAAGMENWASHAAAELNGFLDLPGVSWWEEFKLTLKSSWLKLRKRVSTVASIGMWLRDQVSPSLAAYVQAVSQGEVVVLVDTINDLLRKGQRRFTKRHHQLILRNEGDEMPEFAVYSFG